MQTGGRGSIGVNDSYLVIGEPNAGGSAGEVDIFPVDLGTFGAPLVRSEPTPVAGHNFGSTVALFLDELSAPPAPASALASTARPSPSATGLTELQAQAARRPTRRRR